MSLVCWSTGETITHDVKPGNSGLEVFRVVLTGSGECFLSPAAGFYMFSVSSGVAWTHEVCRRIRKRRTLSELDVIVRWAVGDNDKSRSETSSGVGRLQVQCANFMFFRELLYSSFE
ncbi:hypothetical protein YC2023_078778 [Brassica napus]